jgi:hypothetical protein
MKMCELPVEITHVVEVCESARYTDMFPEIPIQHNKEQAFWTGRYRLLSVISPSKCCQPLDSSCLRRVFNTMVFTKVLIYILTFRTGVSESTGLTFHAGSRFLAYAWEVVDMYMSRD